MQKRTPDRIEWIALLVSLALLLGVLAATWAPGYKEPDPDGYAFLAKRMAEGRPLTVEDDFFRFRSHVWVEPVPGRVTAKFAPGVPALMALGIRLFGDAGLYYVSPLMAALTLAGAFLLFRRWLTRTGRCLAILTLAALPYFLFMSQYPLAHASSLAFVTWAMLLLWIWWERRRAPAAFGAGLLAGLSILMRPTNVLLLGVLVAVACFALAGWRPRTMAEDDPPGPPPEPGARRPWGGAALLFLGYAVGPLLFLWYNAALFGSPLLTGYALSNEQGAFSIGYLWRHMPALFDALYASILYGIFPFGLLGLLMAGRWPDRVARGLWFLPIFLLYSMYYWMREGPAYGRFLYCTLPLLVATGYGLFESLVPERRRRIRVQVLLFVFVVFSWIWNYQITFGEHILGRSARSYAAALETVTEALPPDATIITYPPFIYTLGQRKAFRVYNIQAFRPHYIRRAYRGPDPNPPHRQGIRDERFRTFYEKQERDDLFEAERALVRRHQEAGHTVAYLIPAHYRNGVRSVLKRELEPHTKVELYQHGSDRPWLLLTVAPPEEAEEETPDAANAE